MNKDVYFTSGTEPLTGASASLSIPLGTLLLDKNGNSLTGNVTTRMTYFNPFEESSLRSFPGGFIVSVANSDGINENGYFTTAGFVAIDMSVNGTEVESFANDVSVQIDIPQGTQDDNGNIIKSGDAVPLWSLDEDTGKWKYESDIEVPALSNSTLYKVKYGKVRHLSYYNLDYFGSDGCDYGAWMKVTSSGDECFSIRYKVYRLSDDRYLNYGYGTSNQPLMQFNYAPPFPVYLMFYDYYDYQYHRSINQLQNITQIGYLEIQEPCNPGITYNVELDPAPSPQRVSVQIDVSARCTNQEPPVNISIDGYEIWASFPNSGYRFLVGELNKGKMTACLPWMERFHFLVYYKGRWHYSWTYNNGQPYLIDQTNVVFTILDNPDICNDL